MVSSRLNKWEIPITLTERFCSRKLHHFSFFFFLIQSETIQSDWAVTHPSMEADTRSHSIVFKWRCPKLQYPQASIIAVKLNLMRQKSALKHVEVNSSIIAQQDSVFLLISVPPVFVHSCSICKTHTRTHSVSCSASLASSRCRCLGLMSSSSRDLMSASSSLLCVGGVLACTMLSRVLPCLQVGRIAALFNFSGWGK